MSARDLASPLWAVTAYFNPAGFHRRLRNYRVFRRHLRIPLLAVELSFDGRFALQQDDADLLVRWQVGDVMWQKERLLNAAWDRLPAHCTEVAWLDCDIVFPDPQWPQQARDALQRHVLLQGFRRLRQLPQDVQPEDVAAVDAAPVLVSVVHRLHHGIAGPELFSGVLERAAGAPSPGIAWLARRDWIRRVRLFDASVIGGGDTAWAAAVLGMPQCAADLHGMGAQHRSLYLQWAATPGLALRTEVGCLAGDVLHLWHGSLADRRSRERHADLARAGFDPVRDLCTDGDAPWCWSDPDAPVAQVVRDYFAGRNEDGRH